MFYRLNVFQCYRIRDLIHVEEDGKCPFLDARFIERLSNGELEGNLYSLQSAFQKISSYMGIENEVGATNEDSVENEAEARRAT